MPFNFEGKKLQVNEDVTDAEFESLLNIVVAVGIAWFSVVIEAAC